MFGDLPPNSIVTGIIFSAALCNTVRPVSVEPVNDNLAILLDVANAAPASLPKPVTMFNTPAGKISPISSINIITLVGVCSAGFTTAVQPAAKAGAIFQANINIGKFHGIISPTTPTGSCNTILTVSLSCSEILPSSARITPAK